MVTPVQSAESIEGYPGKGARMCVCVCGRVSARVCVCERVSARARARACACVRDHVVLGCPDSLCPQATGVCESNE